MSEWQPMVVRIEKVEHHSNADALDIATVLGDYPVIVKRDEYRVGDLTGYVPIDSIVPDTEQWHFLSPKAYEKYEDEQGQLQQRQLGSKYPVGSLPEKFRIIKAKKIRGIYSMGMLVNIGSWLNDPMDTGPASGSPMSGIKYPYEVGDSIVEYLNLKKWEEPEEESLPGMKRTSGANAEKPPQGWTIPHYDVGGIRKYLDCLQEGEEICLTEKLHGSNSAFSHDGTRLWTKSRNWYKRMDPDDMWWDIAIRYDLETKLQPYPHMVFFGEVVGQVKGFRYDSTIESGKLLTTIHFFDVWDTKKLRYLDYDERVAMIREAGLSPVPLLYRGPWTGKAEMYPYAEGMSTINPKHIREGAVLVPVKERYEPRLDSRLQLKIIGEGYSLQK